MVDSSFSKYHNERTIESSYLKQIRIKEQCHFGYFKNFEEQTNGIS
jgi:hypothetical protein